MTRFNESEEVPSEPSPDTSGSHSRPGERLFHIHSTLAHVPPALIATALAFYVAGVMGYERELGPTSRMCMLAALIALPPTALSGFLSWRRSRGGSQAGIFRAKIVGSVLLMIATVATLGPELAQKANRVSYGVGLVISLWIAGLLAHLGGMIVHRRIGLK